MVKHGRILQTLLIAPLALTACKEAPPEPFPQWLHGPATVASTTRGFKLLSQSATDAEKAAPELVGRVSFTPGMKRLAIEKLHAPLRGVRSALEQPCKFEFQPTSPGVFPKGQAGWRLLGRMLAWRIERAIAAGKPAEAIDDAVLSIRLGLSLTGGSATDASLGFSIATEAVSALAPALASLDEASLGRLIEGIADALESTPPLSVAITNEKLNMLFAVQTLQKCYEKRDYSVFPPIMGSDAKEAVAFLRELASRESKERARYFEGFAAEADRKSSWLLKNAALPAATRLKEPTYGSWRPWKRFSKHFLSAADPLLALRDRSISRIRLLLIEASVRRSIASHHTALPSLASLPAHWKTDPFSGRPFVYRADGVDYKLYSVGDNLQDDGGDTNEKGEAPDFVLVEAGG